MQERCWIAQKCQNYIQISEHRKKKRRRKKRDKILMNFPDAATCTFGNVVHHFLVLFEELCNHPVVGLIIQEVASK